MGHKRTRLEEWFTGRGGAEGWAIHTRFDTKVLDNPISSV